MVKLQTYKLFLESNNIDQEDLNDLFLLALKTEDFELIKMFINKGADVSYESTYNNVLDLAYYDDEVFEYLIKKGSDPKIMSDATMTDFNIQKILIDNGFDELIDSRVGFNKNLKNDPKYSKIVRAYEEGKNLGIL